ncbi:barstar family protein [Streptomyces roseus]|uniref:barstar family protein n=1 Tax=Streptomyces roseus TaxID=66430 RepID=UPI00069DF99D|nr:barstar family protein [Streptomyces roseus]
MTAFDVAKPESPWIIFGPREAVAFKEQTATLRAAGGRVYEVQARDLVDGAAVCNAFARAVGYPGSFGWNWDALVDRLDDLGDALTGGVGIVMVVRGADALLGADHLRLFMTMLCIGADRANSEVDPDGDLRDEPVVIEHPDLVVGVEGDFLTVTLNLDVWRPRRIGRPKVF